MQREAEKRRKNPAYSLLPSAFILCFPVLFLLPQQHHAVITFSLFLLFFNSRQFVLVAVIRTPIRLLHSLTFHLVPWTSSLSAVTTGDRLQIPKTFPTPFFVWTRKLTTITMAAPVMGQVKSSILGFPRMGENRELKKATESYWAGKITADQLLQAAKQVRVNHWTLLKNQGLDIIPSNDFSYYDQVLDHAILFNAIPDR